MSARLVRLVPTGETFEGIDCMKPEMVEPLAQERIEALWREHQEVFAFARALEQEHGIGRRMDA